MLADRRVFQQRLEGLLRRQKRGQPFDQGLTRLTQDLQKSNTRFQQRLAALPTPSYPEELPVSGKREQIAEAIKQHQVVVVAGETGSGKTTQIPKICLELGRGVAGMIGHTQPRRIAARSVAARIAEEMNSPLGDVVGYKIRFNERVKHDSYIKLMTDGILLAEIQRDHRLEHYDTIIIDEAHERSLNIDFLLGYLKQLLPKRPDLKVIITSATINTERFSSFFNNAPIIEVSGRTYPVEVRYRPLLAEDEDSRQRDQGEAIIEALHELQRVDPLGDTLIFLAGERDIREVAELLHKQRLRDTEILPLYSRLSANEQDRVFKSHRGRRIVLATNVAETSLTVPGIRFVIDPGYARISRYSTRSKVQRLPIEPISQAAANQRKGRCGRVSDGVCIRLYSEEDFVSRPEFPQPELLRTNLASVILQMSLLDLGDIAQFPFIEPPDSRQINDGYHLLNELGAIDSHRNLTKIGQHLAKLPLDPRLARMIVAGAEEGGLNEVMIIVSALAIQDPRERPLDAQQKADEVHKRFEDKQSDFISLIKLWEHYHEQKRHLSQNKLRKLCRDEFLSYLRLREWHDIHTQIVTLAHEMGLKESAVAADYDQIHRALLTGLLGNVAIKDVAEEKSDDKKRQQNRKGRYLGGRNIRFDIFPGSALHKKQPKWVMAAEIVETSKRYARMVASIEPEWIEPLASHLVKRSYSEPHWQKRRAQVVAYEQVTLYGLIVVNRRPVNYGAIDPVVSREIFIHEALVRGHYQTRAGFFFHNNTLIEEMERIEAKARRRDVMVDEDVLFAFYDERIPAGITNGSQFEKWNKQQIDDALFMSRDLLIQQGKMPDNKEQYPDHITLAMAELPLHYHFEPGHPRDGVTVDIPLPLLNELDPSMFDWLVEGLFKDKLIALIKGLPKPLRRNFVPAINFAEVLAERLSPAKGDLFQQISHELLRMTGVKVEPSIWQSVELPDHLLFNLRIVDNEKLIAQGRNLGKLQQQYSQGVRKDLRSNIFEGYERDEITCWDFGELKQQITLTKNGVQFSAYPALVDKGQSVSIRLFESADLADRESRQGLCRLFNLENRDKIRYIEKEFSKQQRITLLYTAIGDPVDLLKSYCTAVISIALFQNHADIPANDSEYASYTNEARNNLLPIATDVTAIIAEVLELHHQIQKRLSAAISPDMLNAISDIKQQLNRLVYDGFLQDIHHVWLKRLPLYLKAIQRRLEKIGQSPQRDRQHQLEVNRLEERVFPKWDAVKHDEAWINARWLIEELRLSYFAQELKTIQPVSSKRLEKVIADLKH